jgi:TetR/AcrR family transcriptional regulator
MPSTESPVAETYIVNQAATRRSKTQTRASNETHLLTCAEAVFAERGFEGASTALIARRAGLPKANLHYYFPTKLALYRRLLEDIFDEWHAAASSFDMANDPVVTIGGYVRAKMALSQRRPLASKVWALEIIQGAEHMQDILSGQVKPWLDSRVCVINTWIAQGKLASLQPQTLLYMIWAVTQHYADFDAQIQALSGKRALSKKAFEAATEQVVELIIRACGARSQAGESIMSNRIHDLPAPACSSPSPAPIEYPGQRKPPPQDVVLPTLRLELEPILTRHADQLFEGLRQSQAYAYIPDEPPKQLDSLRERYQKLSLRVSPDGSEAWLNWAICIKNTMTSAGYVQATVRLADNHAQIAYHVIPSHWRQGIGKEAVTGMLLFLFKEYEIIHVEAHIDTRNIASIALVTALGFTLVRHVNGADNFKGCVSHEDHYRLSR